MGGLHQYLAAYRDDRRRRAESKEAEPAARQQRDAETALEVAYIAFRRARARAVFDALAAEERSAIETLAKGSNTVFERKPGSLGAMMLDLASR